MRQLFKELAEAIFWVVIITALAFGAVSLFSGCACTGGGQSAHPPVAPPLTNVAKGLDHIIILATIAVGLSIGLFFLLPAAHRLSLSIAVAAGGVEVSAIFLRVSLPWLPWVCLALAGVAGCIAIYELVTKRTQIESAIGLGDNNAAPPPAK